MKNLTNYEDVLKPHTTALALYTDGMHLTIDSNGISTSGRWRIAEQRTFKKVLIYKRLDSYGEIYIGDYHSKTPGEFDSYVSVHFKNASLAGKTRSLWTEFTKQPNGRSQRIYLPRPTHDWREPSEENKYIEGATMSVMVNKYERDHRAREECIKHHGTSCSVCAMDFASKYGEDLGNEFIHVHHIVPLSKIRKSYKVDPKVDLRPVCPNCHAMLHRANLTPDQLRKKLDSSNLPGSSHPAKR